jgi:arylamine N-acetyltransferase
MDGWRIQQQQQQQQQRMAAGGVGPIVGYHHPMRSRSSPYQIGEMQHPYSYSQTQSSTTPLVVDQSLSPVPPQATTPNGSVSNTPIPMKNDAKDTSTTTITTSTDEPTTSSDGYTTNGTDNGYTQAQMQQRMMAAKTGVGGPMVSYHPGQQQIMAARARAMPYAIPSHHSAMYPTQQGPVCHCAQHMQATSNGHYPPPQHLQHPMYYHQQQQQQQQHAWYQYHQQQAWRQHQIQQQMQHHHHHHQSMPIEQNLNTILSDTTTTAKTKTTKSKAKKKSTNSIIPISKDESLMKYQQSTLPLSVQQQQQRPGIPPPPPSTSYYSSTYQNSISYTPPQQLPPPSDHPMFAQTSPTLSQQQQQQIYHQSQIFTSPLSNPGTPHQMHNGNGEFNATEFGVPYQHGASGSVNSLTDALCPGGDTTDRQMTPGPPSVGTPRVAPHQYTFPHTPLTPQTNNQNTNPHTPSMMPPTPNPLSAPPTPLTRPRSSGDQTQSLSNNHFQSYEQMTTTSSMKSMHNIDDLAAYLKDPTNLYLADDLPSTLLDDIDALANTYLGQQSANGQQTTNVGNSADELLLNFLCSDDLTTMVCTS